MADRSRRRVSTTRAFAGLALVVLAVGLVACGGDPNEEAKREGCSTGAMCAEVTTTLGTMPIELTFRPVLAVSPGNDEACPASTDPPADAVATLEQCENGVTAASYVLGPVALGGSSLASATAVLSPQQGEWVVNPVFKPGVEGIDAFNAVAARCYAKAADCPTGQLAMVADGVVVSAPVIQTASFEADQIQITGFTEQTATALAAGIDAAS